MSINCNFKAEKVYGLGGVRQETQVKSDDSIFFIISFKSTWKEQSSCQGD